jgi:TonB-dependent SusC/RagA subfamily outer membrane receptor
MRRACTLYLFLFSFQYSVKVAAQAVPVISPKIITLKTAQIDLSTVVPSDTLRKASYHSHATYTSRDRHTPELLFIVDGKVSSSEIIKRIGPNDIENINVVKGNQATALYGQKGSNGVIIITTKHPHSK